MRLGRQYSRSCDPSGVGHSILASRQDRPEAAARRGGGRDPHRLPDRGARRRAGPAVSEGQPPGASTSLRPGPGPAGGRPRDVLGGERAAGPAVGCEISGDTGRGPDFPATSEGREGAWHPPREPIPGRDRGANPRPAAGLRPGAEPRPRRAGDGPVGRLEDRDPRPGQDRGSGGDQVNGWRDHQASVRTREGTGPQPGPSRERQAHFAPETRTNHAVVAGSSWTTDRPSRRELATSAPFPGLASCRTNCATAIMSCLLSPDYSNPASRWHRRRLSGRGSIHGALRTDFPLPRMVISASASASAWAGGTRRRTSTLWGLARAVGSPPGRRAGNDPGVANSPTAARSRVARG